MIQQLSQKIARVLANNSSNFQLDLDEISILSYSLECLINILISTSLILICCFFMNSFILGIIWIFLFSISRNYIGGYHAPNHLSCILSSILICIVSIILCHHITFNLFEIIPIGLIILCIVTIIAPVSSRKNILLSNKQQITTKCKALVTTTIAIFISVIFRHFKSLTSIIILTELSVVFLALLEISIRKFALHTSIHY